MLLSDRIMATTHVYRMLNTTRVSAVGSCLQGELEVFRFCTGTDPNTVLLVKCAYGMQEALSILGLTSCRPIHIRCISTNGSVCHVIAVLYIRVIACLTDWVAGHPPLHLLTSDTNIS
jgi:hypothetical protein